MSLARTGRVDLGGDSGPENAHPTWTSDGATVVYAVTRGLVLARADGRGRREIETATNASNGPFRPIVSPRRSEVAFDGAWLARLDDGRIRRLLTGERYAWSPDGRRLAFIRVTDEGRQLLGLVNRDGTRRRWLTWCERCSFLNEEEEISWSPDGRRILLTLGRYGHNAPIGHDIYVVDVATKRMGNMGPTSATPSGLPTGGGSRFSAAARSDSPST